MDRGLALFASGVLILTSCTAGATNAATGAASIVPTATVAREQTIPTAQAGLVPLAKVVDGDTIKARINGRLETIRVIGIDTPELVDRRRPVQCFGREASAKARQLLDGQNVALIADATQTNSDKYQRLLRYVEPERGGEFGLWMIANGYAHEYTYRVPYQRQAQYKAAQASAMRQNLGLWSATTCNGDTTKAAKER